MRRSTIIVLALCLCMILVFITPTQAKAAEEIASGTCGTDVTWVLNSDGVLIISGTGDITDYLSSTDVPWTDYRESIQSIVVKEGITGIGINAFFGCSNATSVELPDSLKAIFKTAFGYCSSLTSIEIPEGVTSLDEYTFSNCTSLKEVSLPKNLFGIDHYAFTNCSSLESIDLSAVTWIEWGAFSGCTNLKRVDLAQGLKQIQESTFSRCTSLEEVVIPNSVTSILTSAFSNCSSLTQIAIPASVTSIKDSVFSKCTSLTEVTFRGDAPTFGGTSVFSGVTATCYYPAGNETWTEAVRADYGGTLTWETLSASGDCGASSSNLTWTISNQVLTISGIGAMADYAEETAPWFMHKVSFSKVVIGEGVTTIGAYAFYNCDLLESIELPSTLTGIGTYAFNGCAALVAIDLPASLTEIGGYAFKNCDSITAVVIPEAVTVINEGIFYSCDGLASVDLHENITDIGNSAFFGCAFTSIDLPDGLQSLGDSVFANCKALTGIEIPAGITAIEYCLLKDCDSLSEVTILGDITSIGSGAFSGCFGLTSFVIPDTVTSIGDSAFYYSYNIETVELPANLESIGDWAFKACYALTRIDIPEGVMGIGANAFENCTALTEAVIPDSVETIGDRAFSGCSAMTDVSIGGGTATTIGQYAFNGTSSLTNLTLGEGVTSIDFYAFFGSNALESIVFPTSLTTIGRYAFRGCDNLQSITFRGDAPNIATNSFYYVTATCYYPANNETYTQEFLTSFYGGSLYWEEEGYEIPTHCGENITWEITEDNTLILTGTGPMYDYSIADVNYTPWYTQRESIRSIIVGEGITYIGNDAFYESTSATSITLPNTVVSIGSQAFVECAIQTIDLPDNLSDIGEYAFKYTKLESISLPNTLTYIPTGLFNGCYELNIVDIPDTLITIGDSAFRSCYELHSLVLPEGLVSIGEYAFALCGASSLYSEWYDANNFTSVSLPSTLKSIGANAFTYCECLTSITLPAGITVLEDGVFAQCKSLSSIVIPANVTSIGSDVFYYCESLSTITFRWAAPKFAESVFFQVNATCYYPSNNSAWTEDKLQDYDGTLLWVAQEMEEPDDGIGDGDNPGNSEDSGTDNSGDSDNSGNSESSGSTDGSGNGNTDTGGDSGDNENTGDIEIPGNTDNSGDGGETISLAIITQPTDQLVKLNGSAQFSIEATGNGLTYQWQYSNNGGVYWYNSSMSGYDASTVTMTATEKRNGQQYRCVITDTNGNRLTSDVATLVIDSGIVITSQPENRTAALGDEVSFTVEADGNGLTYQWQYSNNGGIYWYNSSMIGYDTSTVSMIATEKRNGQQYRCVITDAQGNQQSTEVAALSIAAAAEVEILTQPSNQTAALGADVIFTVEASGEGLTYQWQYSTSGIYWFDSGMTGNDTDTLTVEALAKRDGQQYRCVITDASGKQVISDAATLIVGSVAVKLAITSQPVDQTAAEGENVTFTVAATGEGLIYQWQYSNNGGVYWFDSGMTGNQTSELAVEVLAKRNGQQYRCVVEDAAGNQVITETACLHVEG